MPAFAYILTALTAYLLGSIPTGYLAGRARGLDIRTLGSGNIGATNALRVLGKPTGIAVLLVDALKGWVAVTFGALWIGRWLFPDAGPLSWEWLYITAALGAVLGHVYTCWLGFKGGKGIATSAGVLLALVPMALLIILTVWIVILAFSRYVSLASILASATLPLACWVTGKGPTLILVTAGMAALVIYKHKTNIERLLAGTENRFGRKKPGPVAPPNQSP